MPTTDRPPAQNVIRRVFVTVPSLTTRRNVDRTVTAPDDRYRPICALSANRRRHLGRRDDPGDGTWTQVPRQGSP